MSSCPKCGMDCLSQELGFQTETCLRNQLAARDTRIAELEQPKEPHDKTGWYVLYHPKLENRSPKTFYMTEEFLANYYDGREGDWRLFPVPSMSNIKPGGE